MDDASFWNSEFTESPAYVDVPDQILKLEILGLRPGSALDLGCGSGKNVLMLAELGWRVTGVDWADEGIRLAQGAVQERGLKATFIVADTTTWSPERRFDLSSARSRYPAGRIADVCCGRLSTRSRPAGR